MLLAIVLGTRPEIIKLAPIIRLARDMGVDFFVVHTGQHYSYELDRVFFDELKLPSPDYPLNVGSDTHGRQTAKMLVGCEDIFLGRRPDAVVVQGDTNSGLAGALAASKLLIPVGHVEAGLRSFDRSMPEELNRVLIDHASTHLYCPTPLAAARLREEGIAADNVFVTGNTIVDSVRANVTLAEQSNVLSQYALTARGYIVLTAHRQENVDSRSRFSGVLEGLNLVSKETGLRVIYPIHPRARKQLEAFHLSPGAIELMPPLSYISFLRLQKEAALVVTDSGGLQEECCILGTPCVTVRDNTERPETVLVGANCLAGTAPASIAASCRTQLAASREWDQPFGDGTTGQQILAHVKEIKCGF